MLCRARISPSVRTSIESCRTECVGGRAIRVGTTLVGEPISKLDHRACMSAKSKVPEDWQPLTDMALVADCQSSKVQPVRGCFVVDVFHEPDLRTRSGCPLLGAFFSPISRWRTAECGKQLPRAARHARGSWHLRRFQPSNALRRRSPGEMPACAGMTRFERGRSGRTPSTRTGSRPSRGGPQPLCPPHGKDRIHRPGRDGRPDGRTPRRRRARRHRL